MIHKAKQITDLSNPGVQDVAGLVTAKGPNGFWIRSPEPDTHDRTSERYACISLIFLFNL
jgi:hypothetical protein